MLAKALLYGIVNSSMWLHLAAACAAMLTSRWWDLSLCDLCILSQVLPPLVLWPPSTRWFCPACILVVSEGGVWRERGFFVTIIGWLLKNGRHPLVYGGTLVGRLHWQLDSA